MCTLVFAHRVADAPVVVLANRDEFFARPSLAPAVRERTPRVFCGLDGKEGGTWFGVNEHGLVVGLTNLTLRLPDASLRSRGLLCMDMLGLRDAGEVREALRALDDEAYNPFNLVALDGTTCVRGGYDDSSVVETLEPGVYATTNWPVGSELDAKRVAVETRVRALIDARPPLAELIDRLAAEGGRHDGEADPRVSVCCHAPGYGTRASTVVVLDVARRWLRVLHADGAPCSSRYVDCSSDVAAMLGFAEV